MGKVIGTLIGLAAGVGSLSAFWQLASADRYDQDAYFVLGTMLGLISFGTLWRVYYGPSRLNHQLESVRHPNVYGPGEVIQKRKREPLFGSGLMSLLIEIGVIILFWWLGVFRFIGRVVDVLFSSLK